MSHTNVIGVIAGGLAGIPLLYLLFFKAIPDLARFFLTPLPKPVLALAEHQNGSVFLEGKIIPSDTARMNRMRRFRPWIVALIAVMLISSLLVVFVRNSGPENPINGYIHVDTGVSVIYLEVNGTSSQMRGLWSEADQTAKGIVKHQWPFSYSMADLKVQITVYRSPYAPTAYIYGTIDQSGDMMTLQLPETAQFVYPALMQFHAANPADWNADSISLCTC